MVGFENPQLLGLLALALPGVFFVLRADDRFSRLVSASHTVVLVLLVLALATPYISVEQSTETQSELVVLTDRSTSAQFMEQVDLELEDVKVRERIIASGNSSDLRNGILRNLEPDTSYLAISDFRSSSSLDQLPERFQQMNSSLSALKPGMRAEASVSIEGPGSTVPGATNSFTVRVHSTGNLTPSPAVYLDGSTVPLDSGEEEGVWKFTESFSERGSHRITATINVSDRYDVNDAYYHSVQVTEKPELLILGEEGSLKDRLERFYDVETARSLPADLSEYYAVIMKETPDREPVNYVSKGNGILYTGSYDPNMDILPVKTIPESEQNQGAKIMLAIDISEGTAGGAAGMIKQIAYNLVETLPYNNRVGAVAYNRDAYIVSGPQPLAENRDFLKDRIASLSPSGPSFHNNGIKGAGRMLNGTGNIILVSDGRVGGLAQNENVRAKAREEAEDLDVQLITVGVGDRRDEEFLQDIAERGNGFYLDAQDSGRLQFRFQAGGAAGRTVPLVVINPNHFITDGLALSSAATFFDPVEPRRSAKLLVTGTSGKPFLTSWRYGLGRVAAFSGGSPELTEVTRLDPLLLTRTVSWAVGDPKRKKDRWLQVENGRVPGQVELQASYRLPGFQREGTDLFTRDVEPESTGFHQVRNMSYGYSYNPELEQLGYSDGMRQTVRATGGEVYTPGEMQELASELSETERRQITTKKTLSVYLLAVALLLFLGEVGLRKMNGKK